MTDFLLLLVGLIGLWLGTEIAVRSSVAIAKILRFSEFFIGLTILAFGSDMPELVVSVDGALHTLRGIDSSGLIVGNAVGSAICQISLVLGISALIHYMTVGRRQIFLLAIELIGSALLLILVGLDGTITRIDGLILVTAFLIYFFTHLAEERRAPPEQEEAPPRLSSTLLLLLLTAGLAVTVLSAELTVDKALLLSERWGVAQSFVGAVLIGLGTSLPELAISLNAIIKKKPGLSVGNILGSNIFDMLIPIGVGATLVDLRMSVNILRFDLPALLVVTGAVIWFLSRKRGLQHWEGAALTVLYLGYVVVKLLWF